MQRYILILFALVSFWPCALYAQDNPDPCMIIAEEIIPLKAPAFDTSILWKKTLGIEGEDRAIDVKALADGGFIVFGQSSAYIKDKGPDPLQAYLIRLDVNGKVIWEKRFPVAGLQRVISGAVVKDKIVVLSEIISADKLISSHLDFFDGAGNLKFSKNISDLKLNLSPRDLVVDSGSNSLSIALWAVNRKNIKDNYTIIERVDLTGQSLSRREYLPGVPNKLESLKYMGDGRLLGIGRVAVENNQSWNQ